MEQLVAWNMVVQAKNLLIQLQSCFLTGSDRQLLRLLLQNHLQQFPVGHQLKKLMPANRFRSTCCSVLPRSPRLPRLPRLPRSRPLPQSRQRQNLNKSLQIPSIYSSLMRLGVHLKFNRDSLNCRKTKVAQSHSLNNSTRSQVSPRLSSSSSRPLRPYLSPRLYPSKRFPKHIFQLPRLECYQTLCQRAVPRMRMVHHKLAKRVQE